jgi:phospholipid transport system substrate-binding protein
MTPQNIKHFLILFSFTVVFSLASTAKVVAAELVGPQVAIAEASVKLKENLEDEQFLNDFAKINRFVEDVIEPLMDFNKIAKLVVGKYWRKATVDEKNDFEKEFKILLVRTYSRAFIGFDNWTLEFPSLNMDTAVKTVENKKGQVIRSVMVKTNILQAGKRPFSISYKMWMVEGEWKTYDIVIEGISLVKNYRKSIGTRIKKTGSGLTSVTAYLAKKNKAALAKKETKEKVS